MIQFLAAALLGNNTGQVVHTPVAGADDATASQCYKNVCQLTRAIIKTVLLTSNIPSHGGPGPLANTSVPAKWHLIPSNSFSRAHIVWQKTYIQMDRPRNGSICCNRRNCFQPPTINIMNPQTRVKKLQNQMNKLKSTGYSACPPLQKLMQHARIGSVDSDAPAVTVDHQTDRHTHTDTHWA